MKSVASARKSKLLKGSDCDCLTEQWAAVTSEINSYVQYLEGGGEMEAPLPGV